MKFSQNQSPFVTFLKQAQSALAAAQAGCMAMFYDNDTGKVSLIDENGNVSAAAMDGAQGPQGNQGPAGATGEAGAAGAPGQGVPAGGVTSQILSKKSNNDYDTQWTTPPTGGGGITDAPNDGNLYGRQNQNWEQIPAGSGGGSGGSGVAPLNLLLGTPLSGNNVGWSNYTLGVRLPFYALYFRATTIQVQFCIGTGPIDVSKAFVVRTLSNSTAVIDSKPITFSGNTATSLPTGLSYSDAINIQIDDVHDYYIVAYLPTSSNNTANSLAFCPAGNTVMSTRYGQGDNSGATDVTAYGPIGTNTFLVTAVKVPVASPGKVFTYQSNGDTNGVFYYLGQQAGSGTWVNPSNTSALTVTASAGQFQGHNENIVCTTDRTTNSGTGEYECVITPLGIGQWIQYDFGSTNKFLVANWLYQERGTQNSSGNGVVYNVTTQITLTGSNDGQTWNTLNVMNGIATAPASWTNSGTVSTTTAYRYLRLTQTQQPSDGQGYFCLGEVEFYGTLKTN